MMNRREDGREWHILEDPIGDDARICTTNPAQLTGCVLILEKDGLVLPIGPVFRIAIKPGQGIGCFIVDADPTFV